jgi:hypothetical protein
MSAEPARHLKSVEEEVPMIVVDADGMRRGSLTDHTQPLHDIISGLERDIKGWTTRYAELKRDKEAEAQESPVWPAALSVFKYWRVQCKHPRSEFGLDRFEMIRPFLERLSSPKKGRSKDPVERLEHAEAVCKLAVDGIAFDCYVTDRPNGTKKRHDGWHLIFGSTDHFENRCNSAPLDRIREVMGAPKTEQATLDQPQPDQ